MTIIFSSQPFYGWYVWHLTPNDAVPSHICENERLWSFFWGCLRAIDGSHTHFSPPAAALQSLYWNWKGFFSQNCLFILNFSMLFTYILIGWEGSATDACVWADALAKGFLVPILLSCQCRISTLSRTSHSISWGLLSSSGVGSSRCLVCAYQI